MQLKHNFTRFESYILLIKKVPLITSSPSMIICILAWVMWFLYLEVRIGFVLTAHTNNLGQMWIWCAGGDVVVVVVVFRCGARDWQLRWSHWHLWSVLTPRDCDLLDGSGHGRGRGNVLVQLVLGCHVLVFVCDGGYLLDDGRDETGAMCTDLRSTEVERVQVVLKSAVVQTLAL